MDRWNTPVLMMRVTDDAIMGWLGERTPLQIKNNTENKVNLAKMDLGESDHKWNHQLWNNELTTELFGKNQIDHFCQQKCNDFKEQNFLGLLDRVVAPYWYGVILVQQIQESWFFFFCKGLMKSEKCFDIFLTKI